LKGIVSNTHLQAQSEFGVHCGRIITFGISHGLVHFIQFLKFLLLVLTQSFLLLCGPFSFVNLFWFQALSFVVTLLKKLFCSQVSIFLLVIYAFKFLVFSPNSHTKLSFVMRTFHFYSSFMFSNYWFFQVSVFLHLLTMTTLKFLLFSNFANCFANSTWLVVVL